VTHDPPLARGIEEIAAEIGGVTAVAARDTARGRALDLRAAEPFPAASVIKIAILIELVARTEEGDLLPSEIAVLRDEDRVEGSGVLRMLHAGVRLTLQDLAHLMITVSDNTASNMLIDRLGCERISARLAALGLRQTRLERRFYDFAARDAGRDNWIAAGEMADLLLAIERRQVVSHAACDRILDILRKQQFTNRIPKLLPPDTPVAHKTGTVSGVCHDAGIIYAPAGPLVLVVLTRGIECQAVAEGGIRHIARLMYDAWGAAAEP
jgi:beta-lactamase class A